jgi:hypothetical protein
MKLLILLRPVMAVMGCRARISAEPRLPQIINPHFDDEATQQKLLKKDM